MIDQLLDGLMYRTEDVSVDFKAQQYMLSKPDPTDYPELEGKALKELYDRKKSEFLKDVLAMANAWREGDGYILLGFKEIKGQQPELMGLSPSDHHDDADLQQFISSRVNRCPTFHYGVYPYRGVTVGVITIPAQQGRPFYAKDKFGVVEARTVYVRRGTTTIIANPDEIAKMGSEESRSPKEAAFDIKLEAEDGSTFGQVEQAVCVVDFGNIDSLEDYSSHKSYGSFNILSDNRDYWRELAAWYRTLERAVAFHISVENRSSFALTDCKIEVFALDERDERIELSKGVSLPEAPMASYNHMLRVPNFGGLRTAMERRYLELEEDRSCIIHLDKILPGEKIKAPDSVVILLSHGGEVRIQYRLLAAEVAAPRTSQLAISVAATEKQWTVDDLDRRLFKTTRLSR